MYEDDNVRRKVHWAGQCGVRRHDAAFIRATRRPIPAQTRNVKPSVNQADMSAKNKAATRRRTPKQSHRQQTKRRHVTALQNNVAAKKQSGYTSPHSKTSSPPINTKYKT